MARSRSIPLLALLALALTLVPAAAVMGQETEEYKPLYPFLYTIKNQVDPEMRPQYRGALLSIVKAHTEHENGRTWAAYAPLTGGPHPTFYYYLPMDKLGDLDEWTPNRQVVTEALGEETSTQVFESIMAAAKTWDLVMGYSKELSHPAAEPGPPIPKYMWVVKFQVDQTRMVDFMALSAKYREAHAAHEGGFNWYTYSNVIGGEGIMFWYFIPFEKMGEIDAWTPGSQILIDHFGQEAADEIETNMAQIAKSKTAILTLVPAFSRPPAE